MIYAFITIYSYTNFEAIVSKNQDFFQIHEFLFKENNYVISQYVLNTSSLFHTDIYPIRVYQSQVKK